MLTSADGGERNARNCGNDDDLMARCRSAEPIRIEAHEVRYLDLSGDGVPDAVEHIDRKAFRRDGSNFVDTVEETRRLSYGIGINGKPAGVTQATTVVVRDRRESADNLRWADAALTA